MTDRAVSIRADTLLSLGRSAEAVTLLSAALATDPDAAELLRLMARALLLADRPAEARTVAERAVAVEPDSEWSFRILSQAYSDLGEHTLAVHAAAESQRLAPAEWRTHCRRAVASAEAGQPHDGMTAARYAIHLAPDQPDPHFALGYAASKARERPLAEQAYLRVLAIQPDHATALNNLATLRLKQRGGLAAATRGFGSALAVDAQLGVARRNLDVVARRYARRFHLAVVVAFLVLTSVLDGGGQGPGDNHVSAGSRWEAAALGTLAFTVMAAAIVVVDRRLPVNLRPYFRRLPRSDLWFGAWLGVDLIALLLIGALALPSTYSGRSSLSSVAWIVLILGLVLSYRHRFLLRSRLRDRH